MLGDNGICMCVGINKDVFVTLHPLTKNYLRKKCGDEIKHIFGGSYKYEKERIKLLGFKTTNEYKTELAKQSGFKTRWGMEKISVLKKFKTLKNYFDKKAKERGFKNYRDYQNFLSRNLGFKDFKDYRNFKMRNLRDFRDKNNLCVRCGKKRDSKFKSCINCRK